MDNRRWMLMLSLELLQIMSFVQGNPIVTIEPANHYTATQITIICDFAGTNTFSLVFKKDGTALYTCSLVGSLCNPNIVISDYSSVDWSQLKKGIITIANAKSTRDSGEWTCEGDSGVGQSAPQRLDVTDADCGRTLIISNGNVSYDGHTYADTATYVCYHGYTIKGENTTTCQANGSWSEVSTVCLVSATDNECWIYWLFVLVIIPCVGLVVVIIIVSRYKTLVISTLYVKVSKNTVQLSWKPFGFEPVPGTLYAKCAQNGLTENAEIIDGLFVVVFRDLVPGQQHDVTVYCQNAADMKLYKSETCVVFTLKDSSITNPKEGNTVLALHSLDLTVYPTKVELSWTAPIAFDSTKVEYWVGSNKHITMSADKTSLATSTAEMTRLLPESVITFTITGEKDGTKYPSGILHQKTLKVLTGCCP